MEKCEPGMQKCGECEKKAACEENPYRDRGPEITEEDWYGYNRIRGWMMRLDESRYNELFDFFQAEAPEGVKEQWATLPEKVRKQFDFLMVKDAILGMERVHRMLLGMKERQEIKLTDPLPEYRGPECTLGKRD